jgi:citrate lyase subunit gamma (acyl carrier protein)
MPVQARAGSLESNDIMIVLEKEKGDAIRISLESTVAELFGDDIRKDLLQSAREAGVSGLHIIARDRGALPCTIRARMQTALLRLKGE